MSELFRRDVEPASGKCALAIGAITIAAAVVGFLVGRSAAASRIPEVTLADPSALSAGRTDLMRQRREAMAALRSSPPRLPPH